MTNKAARARLRTLGRFGGGRLPYGWVVGANGTLEPNAEQQQIINHMMAWRIAGASWRTISMAVWQQFNETDLSHAGCRKIVTSALARQAEAERVAKIETEAERQAAAPPPKRPDRQPGLFQDAD